MHNVFEFNRAIVTNTSKYNLAEGLDLKNPMQVLLSYNNAYCQNLDQFKKGYLICNTRTLNLLCQVIACMPIYKTYVLLFSLQYPQYALYLH